MLRVVVADDERPARSFLVALLREMPGVEVVAEVAHGAAAVQAIEALRPDVAMLDLEMPEVSGLDVVRLVRPDVMPLVVFVTAHDEYAVTAFEVNAVDYLTKPVAAPRLRETLRRLRERIDREDRSPGVAGALQAYDRARPPGRLDRIPVRRRDDIVLVPVTEIASIVADGELLHLSTSSQQRHTISYRLKDLEARLDPARFIRLGRGTLVNVEAIARVTPLPGGTYTVTLRTGQQLDVSRIQSKVVRERLLML